MWGTLHILITTNRMQKDDAPEEDDDFGADQCDLNLSPVQSGRLIIELHAAMEVNRHEKQSRKRYSVYQVRSNFHSQSGNFETQDCVQLRFRSLFEHIQDHLIRGGRKNYNPGPGLFRQVLESDIRDPKEKKEAGARSWTVEF
ncbi:MAG: hypothetical protein EZS28_010908 [Streblomastix strix]|uniref:Uncharacterized protein n=1 Tax=Streblomastix strix TaxID=222440 RepID=A0A5J4WF39_9EUKA|nr:MAG: hypothetical protein EZS28_010908 [Streblomastix strix]